MKFALFAPFFTLSALYCDPVETFSDPIFQSESILQNEQIDLDKLSQPLFPLSRPYKSPALSATLSSLFPGLGHCYLNDYQTALELSGCAGVGFSLAISHNSNRTFSGIYTLATAYSYGIYAAYRDAHIYNGSTFKMPKDSFADLAKAYFNPRILKKPEVWGGFLGGLVLATAISYAADKSFSIHPSFSVSKNVRPFSAFFVGIAEESIFRGYLQSQLAETFNPTTGIVLSSLAFGAAHIGNAHAFSKKDQLRYYTFILPFITVFGGYFGWLTNKNSSLQESVAIHGWYDFTLFAIDSFVSKKAKATIKAPREFSVGFAF